MIDSRIAEARVIEVGEPVETAVNTAEPKAPRRPVRPAEPPREPPAAVMGRFFSRFFLLPLQYLWNTLSYIYGFAFLAAFCLGFLRSPELESVWLVAALHQAVQPLIISASQLLAAIGVVSPDAYQAIPLALSVMTWLMRPWFLNRLKLIRSRLERPVADLFAPGRDARSLLWKRLQSRPSRDLQDSEFGPVESSARLIRTAPLPTIARRYELLEEIGRGPVGAVYKALDLQIGRFVAVKMVFCDSLSPEELRQQRERLYREARIAGKLQHPGIATILDLSEDESGAPFIVMEYAECRGLDQALPNAAEPPTLKERLAVAIRIARALDFAHQHGVVHRDIKPSNILITAEGRAKIGDFGIAKPIDREIAEVSGTPAFVAPELMEGAPASARTDIFSLGVVLYWLFTGEMPFAGRSLTEIIYNVANVEPPPARQINWALPAEMEPILRKCLAKKPSERYESAGKLAADLAALRRARRKQPKASASENGGQNGTLSRQQSRRAAG
jgi:hypothetical protein